MFGTGSLETGSISCFGSAEKSPARSAAVGTNVTMPGRRNARARALVRAEEEELVFDDRPADSAAELVALQRVLFGREEVARVQGAVAQELERAAVQFVRARLGHHVDDAATRVSVLRAEVARLQAEFLEESGFGKGRLAFR